MAPTLSVTGAAYDQTAGMTTVNGTLSSDQTVSLTGGTLDGTGAVSANLSNGETVAPGSGSSPGILTIDGNYAQTSSGTLSVDLAGTAAGTNYSQLVVTGTATMSGGLTVSLNYTPQSGDSYEIVNAPSLSGNFNNLPEGGVILVGEDAFSNSYLGGTGTDDVLSYQPNTVIWTGLSTGDWSTGSDWSTGNVPGTNSNVIIGTGKAVTISSGENYSIDSLALEGTLVIGDADNDSPLPTLTVATTTAVSGTLQMYGSTLDAGGNISISGAGSTFDWYDGTVTGGGQLIVSSSGTVDIANGINKKGNGFQGRILDMPLVNSGTVIENDSRNSFEATINGAITNEAGAQF